MRELVIVRTHVASPRALQAYDRWAEVPGCDVVFCCDERAGPVEVGGRRKIALRDEDLERLGLLVHPRAGLRCGDYFYYAAREARPDHGRYWLVEPDVHLSFPDHAAFHGRFRDAEADFLAGRFGERKASWPPYGRAKAFFPRVYGCAFAISRASGAALDHLVAARRRASAAFGGRPVEDWPEDAAFVCSELVRAGFACHDFNDAGGVVHTKRSLADDAVHYEGALEDREPDGLIHHPVRDFPGWLDGVDETVRRTGGTGALEVERGTAFRLLGAGQLLVRRPGFAAASVVPFALARHGFEAGADGREAGRAGPDGEPTADAGRIEYARSQWRRNLGGGGRTAPSWTAHPIVTRARPGATAPARPSDFGLGEGYPGDAALGGFALPYCFDFEARRLLLTLHLRPERLLEYPFLYAAQREEARVLARVDFADLDRAFGDAAPGPEPTFIFSIGRVGSTLLDRLLSCATPRTFSEPDTVTQLGLARRHLRSFAPEVRDRIVRHSVQALLQLRLPGDPGGVPTIKLRSQANAAIGEVMRVFPGAKFVFLLRERRAWARSTYRAFRLPPGRVVHRLLEGLAAVSAMLEGGVAASVLFYEEIVASPLAVVASVLGDPAPLGAAVEAEVAATMLRDSQERSRISRARTSRAAPEEEAWLAQFEELWAEARPAERIGELAGRVGRIATLL